MSGVTLHIYKHEIQDVVSMWNKQLECIQRLLPRDYTGNDIVATLKCFYPHEWHSVEIKYWYYQNKDNYLKKRFGKARYNMERPKELLNSSSMFRKLLSAEYRELYAANYSEKEANELMEELWKKRKPKIERINQKIERAKSKTQQVTPQFIDQLIGLYERKNTSQKDRMYILTELKKYYSPAIIQFFFKLNDTELNKQLRWIAFFHLQSFNYHPRARRQKYMQVHTRSKKRKEYLKRVYPDERYTIPKTPMELEYRIENAKEQKIKAFDYFVSHSYMDSSSVQKIIIYENSIGKNVFCDWISDSDYLKRNLICNATLKVLEKRLEQSKCLLFVDSNNSRHSVWCKYELNFFEELGKPMYVIAIDDIENGLFDTKPLLDKWYLDPAYKEQALIEGTKVTG